MTGSTLSPVAGVEVMPARVARDLVEQFGLPKRQAATPLGTVEIRTSASRQPSVS